MKEETNVEGSKVLFSAGLNKKLMGFLLALVTLGTIVAYFGGAKTVYVIILGLITVILLAYLIPQLLKKGDIMIVTEKGFLDRRNGYGFIRWSDVKAISARTMNDMMIARFDLRSGQKAESPLGNLQSDLDQTEIYDLLGAAYENAEAGI